ARAIANRPKVLIADEPTGNLDPAMSDEIMTLLEKINREYGTTILMVTHDLALVNKHRKRTIALEHGHITADLKEGGYVQHDQ
ncbi:MAG: cell division ATP-binding protein FtsE, partial [Solobacterium sp.]|nr:cell division ATP-binding protein FtsE [Solobacterium sp.]